MRKLLAEKLKGQRREREKSNENQKRIKKKGDKKERNMKRRGKENSEKRGEGRSKRRKCVKKTKIKDNLVLTVKKYICF